MNERTVATARPDRPFGWRFTAPLLLGSTLNPINSSMIATALVGIGADMHAGPGADREPDLRPLSLLRGGAADDG